ncbi:SpvB/TcaC N-terminal domain-containing protein [uncultured Chryseobacterium sp.]|uniref:SpvB/TcaC N-terminal domain-containing protein n=1 Tax=uncultured Chryseobacterium sp. TaxID=259322 RepID=UPI0025F38FAF|nr:SpvB/TcaC N-terminal domain-containing protein [uncultured Chryseobacterium sp.]
MKTYYNRQSFTRRSVLLVCFFASMLLFAGFTKEDRQKVRALKLRMMEKYVYHSTKGPQNPQEDSPEKNTEKKSGTVENTVTATATLKNPAPETVKENGDAGYIFEAVEKQGIIGEFSDDESDNASDNFFTVTIPEIKNRNAKAYLVYDLFGLGSYHSVSRSINRNIAFGGNIIIAGSRWSTQKEEIAVSSLEKGKNTILFTSSLNGVKYKVKNVKIIFENNANRSDVASTLLSGNHLYVKGISDKSILIRDKPLTAVKGEYETLIELTDSDKAKGFISITGSDGVREYRIPKSETAFKTVDEEKYKPFIISVSKDMEYTGTYEDTGISIEKNSVEHPADVQILKLRKKDYPAVSREIKSMTVNSGAYRLENPSGEFKKTMVFSFPYDEKKLGARSAKEIKAFYFDYASKKWKVDPTGKVDTEKKVIRVETKGDTDYINGVISVPESSQLEAFAPTSISGLKAADPTAGLQLMEVPTATQKGDASAGYPIRVPAGLGGLQPSLSIGYNSGGGDGWMGNGWSVNGLSSITVDTRWGTPVFDTENGGKETELYSLDGEMLVYPNGYLPHRHNDVSETNTAITTDRQPRSDFMNGNVKQFYLRKNHDFTLIERIGTAPSNYTWKVTSTDGTKRYYGGTADSMLSGPGGIVHWGLRMVEDVHGNTMEFTYYNEFASGVFFQIKKIAYGKNKDYTVNFNKEATITRKDITFNAKQGIARSDAFLLKNIEVKYKNELIRTYKMDYIDGEFFKTLLKRIYIVPNNPCSTTLTKGTGENTGAGETVANETGKTRGMDDGSGGNGGTNGGIEPACNEITDSYTFDYYNDVKDGQGTVKLFGPDTTINVQNDKEAYSGFVRSLIKPSKINGNISSETGLNVRVAAGLNFYTPSNDPYGHLMFGFPFGNSKAKARNAQQLVDFNGDGIQDMIYRVPGEGLFLRTGKLDGLGSLSFNGSLPIENYSGGDFSYTETKTNNRGWDMGAIIYSQSEISSTTRSSTKTYLIDANSDGLMDIVNDGEVWFNRFDSASQKSEMTKHSEYTENMVVKARAIKAPIRYCGDVGADPEPCPEEPVEDPMDITDVVKVWVASRDGYVRFRDRVSIKSMTVPAGTTVPLMYYGVEIKNPTPSGNGGSAVYSNTRIYLKKIIAGDTPQDIVINRYNDYYSDMQGLPLDNNYGITNGITNPDRLYVKSGEKIYIRLHKSKVKDVAVLSDPMITYVDENTGNDLPNTYELSQDQFQLNNGKYGSNLFLNNAIAPIYLDADGDANINIERVYFPYTNDSFTFRVVAEDAITGVMTDLVPAQAYLQNNSAFFTIPQTLSLHVDHTHPVYLKFLVESDSQTDFFTSNWNGRITVDYSATVSYAPSPVYFSYLGVPEYPSYAVTKLTPQLDIYNVPGAAAVSGTHDFGIQLNKNIPNSFILGTGSFYYIIKKGHQVLGKRKVSVGTTSSGMAIVEQDMVSGQNISGFSSIPFFTGDVTTGALSNDHLVTVQVYCKTSSDYALFNLYSSYFQGKPFTIYYDGNTEYGKTSSTSVNTAMYNTKTLFFNNWSQFLYKPVIGDIQDYKYGAPIRIDDFPIPVTTQNTYQACLNPSIYNNNDSLAECILNATPDPNVGNNTLSQTVSAMKVDITKRKFAFINRWVGSGPEQFSGTTNFNTDDTVSYFTDPVPTVPVVTPTTYTSGQLSVDTTMKAISRDQNSSSHNKTKGGTLGPVSGGNSETTSSGSFETQTFSDMNGDGYPDMVYQQSMQLTNATGSLEDIQLVPYSAPPTWSLSYQKSNSAGFSYNTPPVTGRIGAHGENGTSTQPDTGMTWAGSASVGFSMQQYYNSYDAGGEFWMDVNGDGLPDRIRGGNTPNMTVALNMGKSLGPAAAFNNLITYKSHPKANYSINLGGGLGSSVNMGALSSFGFGISAGVSASSSIGTADAVYEDVNGDGLIDILEVASNGASTVRYNLGNRFDTAVPLLKSAGEIDFANETRSYNGSFSFGGNYMLNLGPIPLIPPAPVLTLWIKAGVGANLNLGMNVSETKKAFRDMNGDGFADLVEDTSTGFIVNYSQMGRTNKLKTITNSFSKGTYLLDYEFSRANYGNPHAKLVVKSISILEPDVFSVNYTTGQGKKMETRYEFRNRKYDRRERDDFGFETVIKREIKNGSAERISTDVYFNNTYLLNGLLRQSTVQSGNGNYLSDVAYTYKLRKFMLNATQIDMNSNLPADYDSGGREGRKMATALLDQKVKTAFESGGSITTTENFSYTPKGLISRYQYTSPSASYNTNITYQALNNNILGVPVLVEVYEGTTNSQLLRRRTAGNINTNNGDVGTYTVFDGTNNSVTDFQYNASGNVTKVTYPPNNNTAAVQRYTIDYTYDNAVTGKYIVEVKDVFNVKSTAIYNPLFDVITRKVDTGGNAMVFTYDGFGRTRTIMGPNEIAVNSSVPTVRYNYWLDHAGIPNNDATVKIYRASTSNFDPEYAGSGNTIMTDTYADFLGRIVQTKKDIEFSGSEAR